MMRFPSDYRQEVNPDALVWSVMEILYLGTLDLENYGLFLPRFCRTGCGILIQEKLAPC